MKSTERTRVLEVMGPVVYMIELEENQDIIMCSSCALDSSGAFGFARRAGSLASMNHFVE
jgi:hypothetical protein